MKIKSKILGRHIVDNNRYVFRDNHIACERDGSIVELSVDAVHVTADITGVDKVYYCYFGECITVSDTFKDFIDQGIDKRFLEFQKTKGFIPYPFTILNGVYKCPPGLITIIRINKEEHLIVQYSPSDKLKRLTIDQTATIASFRNSLQKMFQENAINYKDIVSSFSGGFDSVLLTETYREKCKCIVHFQEDDRIPIDHYKRLFPNRQWIIANNEEKFSKEDLRRYFVAVDEPCCDSAGFAEYLMIRRLSKGYIADDSVVMNGQLADGIFANGRVFFQEYCSSFIPKFFKDTRIVAEGQNNILKKIRNYSSGTKSRFERFCYGSYRFLPEHQEKLDQVFHTYEKSIENDSTNMLAVCIILLRYSIYGIEKIRTAAHALDIKYYVPFMSENIIRLGISIPARRKVGYHLGKRILIDAFPEVAIMKYITRDFRPQTLKERLIGRGHTEEEYKEFFLEKWIEYNIPKSQRRKHSPPCQEYY
jgi:asparagine synthetase B (glutamine-hydrolysing)